MDRAGARRPLPRARIPLAPPGERDPGRIDEYERVQTPVYALLYGLAQATVGERRGGADPSARIWQMMGGGGLASRRGCAAGCSDRSRCPARSGVANRLGLGPVRSDLSAGAIGRAGFEAMGEVVERSRRSRPRHVVFGHTHRRGGPEPGRGAQLWNTGSWVHSPGLLGESAAVSPYWPGTVCFVGDDGEPELRHLLDELAPADLGRDRPPGA